MKKLTIFIVMGCLLALFATPAYANDIPELPHAFYGTVTINNNPAPDGTLISATVAEGEVLTTSQNPVGTVNDNYGIEGLHLLVQGYGLSGAITFYVNGVEVEDATATFEAGGGPTPQILDLVLESGVTAQKVETVAAGETDYEIDFSTEAGTVITVDTKTDEGEVTITVKKYADNPHPDADLDLPPDTEMLPRYIDIHVDNPDAIDWPMYVEQTYTDAEVAGLDESSLGMCYFTADPLPDGAWHRCKDTDVEPADNYVWADMWDYELSGSPVAIGGTAAVEPAPAPEPEPEPEPTPRVGGAGAPPWIYPTLTGLVGAPTLRIDSQGIIRAACCITTSDGKLTLDIARDTELRDSRGSPLRFLSAAFEPSPPPPPAGKAVITAYDLGPDGATFSPAITLTIKYDPGTLPEGCAEKDLCISYWDGEKCCDLETTCDVKADKVSCQVSHFTIFAVIGTIPPPVPAPAAFSVSEFSIQPARVQPNETVTIIASVANTGGTEGTYSVVLKINGVKEAEKSVTIAAGESQDVSFSVIKEEAGSYSVDVDGLSGSFTIVALPVPVPVPPPAPPPVKPMNWPLIGGIIAGAVVVGLLIFFLVRRRGAY